MVDEVVKVALAVFVIFLIVVMITCLSMALYGAFRYEREKF